MWSSARKRPGSSGGSGSGDERIRRRRCCGSTPAPDSVRRQSQTRSLRSSRSLPALWTSRSSRWASRTRGGTMADPTRSCSCWSTWTCWCCGGGRRSGTDCFRSWSSIWTWCSTLISRCFDGSTRDERCFDTLTKNAAEKKRETPITPKNTPLVAWN